MLVAVLVAARASAATARHRRAGRYRAMFLNERAEAGLAVEAGGHVGDGGGQARALGAVLHAELLRAALRARHVAHHHAARLLEYVDDHVTAVAGQLPLGRGGV